MKYSVYLSLVLLCTGSISLHGYCNKALKEFAQKGYSTCCQDFTNANLSPIIKDLVEHPPIGYKCKSFFNSFRSINNFVLGTRSGTLINLQNADLSGANISNVDLSMANLNGIICDEKTNFSGSRFSNYRTKSKFDLSKAQLQGAHMTGYQVETCLGVTHNHKSGFLLQCPDNCPVYQQEKERKIILTTDYSTCEFFPNVQKLF